LSCFVLFWDASSRKMVVINTNLQLRWFVQCLMRYFFFVSAKHSLRNDHIIPDFLSSRGRTLFFASAPRRADSSHKIVSLMEAYWSNGYLCYRTALTLSRIKISPNFSKKWDIRHSRFWAWDRRWSAMESSPLASISDQRRCPEPASVNPEGRT
jgi:hypothetical protein